MVLKTSILSKGSIVFINVSHFLLLSKGVRDFEGNGFERGFEANLQLFYPDVLMLSKG